MDAAHDPVLFPASFQELFSGWERFPDAQPFAGGTQFLRCQGTPIPRFPRHILSLDRLEDLRRITRTERYLEIGAMVHLNEIINLGKVVPEVLIQCLAGITGPQIRNLATIGGHLCTPSHRMDATAAMIALDAHYELRSAASARWISTSRFYSYQGPLPLGPQELLTRIRIPLEPWTYTAYKKCKPDTSGAGGGVMALILRNQKNVLTDIRIVFTGDRVLQDRNTESLLQGKRLPLERKHVILFVEQWKSYLGSLGLAVDLLQDRLLNFIESSLLALAD
ncbi:MAG: FAD binding domain-containing protein [Treponema sp.]|jgi:CO/xanthine dehydrogenase FAD-binding subunit|nr:FAD binding domain-containing protein [Treponema sp.]